MLRRTVPFLLAFAAMGPAVAADVPAAHPGRQTRFGTMGAPGAPYARRLPPDENPDILFTPSDGLLSAMPSVAGRPLLPGSSTLPGYYGSSHSYDYQGPYYGGPYVGYWNRLPYACGVYGYC